MGIFVHDQGAQVAAVEHHDVGRAGFGIEVHEGADQDAEGQAQVVGQDRGRGHVLVVAGLMALGRGPDEYMLKKVVQIPGFLLTEEPFWR